MYTPMDEPLSRGLTTTGSAVRASSSSLLDRVTVTVSHRGVVTRWDTSRLVRSLSIAMAEPRQPEPV